MDARQAGVWWKFTFYKKLELSAGLKLDTNVSEK